MKIDLSFVPLDKDGPARASGNAETDRSAMGDAFGKAVRDAGGQRSAKANDKTAGTDGEAKAAAGAASDGGEDGEAATEPAADGAGQPEPQAVPLQSLLGALAGLTAQKGVARDARHAQAQANDETGQGIGMPVPKDRADGESQGVEGLSKGKGSMQLDVLRMETHFEPHQDGMVLVEGGEDAARLAIPVAPADPKSKTGATGANALVAELADKSRPKATEGKITRADDKAAASDEGGALPISFDEALARLGREDGSRSGRETTRDGSAGAQSTLVELSARRNSAKAADGVAASASLGFHQDAMPSSPYNLAGQVAGPIMEALGDPGQAPAETSSASRDAHLRMRAGGGALKTLTIQLHPEHLGTVDVSLRLNEGRLTLELAASRSDTATMLLDDQASLRKLLEHAGFSLDDAAISVVTRDSGQVRPSDGNGASGSQPRDANGNPSGEGRSETRGQSGGSDEQSGRRRAPSRHAEDASPAAGRTGATYL